MVRKLGNFKEWLIQEMAHFTLPKAIRIGNFVINAVDLRFEDYPKDTEDEKGLLIRLLGGKEPYYGRLPKSNRYAIYDGHSFAISPEEPIGDKYIELPNPFKNGYTWWDYAAGIYFDPITKEQNIVKRPLKFRTYD